MKFSDVPGSEFMLDAAFVRRSFGRAARTYDEVAVLQAEVRRRLLERLDIAKIDPAVIVDAGTGTGRGARDLKRRFKGSQVVAVDTAWEMLDEARRHRGVLRRFARVCGDVMQLPLRDRAADLVFSNLMLQWCNDPDAAFAEIRRSLRPGGLLTFTAFGPDTLAELRKAWAAADAYTHVNRFVDMHDLGDALLRAGFVEPVLDVERFTLTYPSLQALVRDLRAMGSRNATAGRCRGLTGKAARSRMTAAYERMRSNDRLPATFEVVYGQAWSPDREPACAGSQGEFSVPLDRIRRRP